MAYDNKNAYPSPSDNKGARSTGSLNVGTTLSEKVLNNLRTCQKDMDKLQSDRALYLKYYMGDKLGNEIDGRSQVVMSKVQDAVESLMPPMMKIFYGGQDVLNLRPQGRDDDAKTKLMEEKVNFDFQKQNDGFKILYWFIKDALLGKMGIVKYYWEKKTVARKMKPLKGVSEQVYFDIKNNPKFRIDSVEAIPAQVPSEMMVLQSILPPTYDIEYSKIKKISRPVAENIPPEEFIFDIHAKDIKTAFCAHKKRIHKNKLIAEYGLSADEVEQTISDYTNNPIYSERFKDLGGSTFFIDEKDKNFVFIYEAYTNDYDESGQAIPMLCTVFADKAIREEDNSYGCPPFVTMSPIMLSHRLCGRSLAELSVEIQKLQTALVRYILDNVYFQNNGMRIVNPFRIDVESLKTGNRPGGMAFTKYDIDPNTAYYPVTTTPLPPHVMQLLEYVDGPISENRTGVTRYNQGLDARSLNKTARGINAIMTAAQQRIELIARVFAETGVKQLFEAFVQMNIDYFDEEIAVKVNQEWRDIRPEDIDGDFDVVIDVGIGTGSRDMAFQQKVEMLNIYQMIAKSLGPAAQQIFTLDNLKNILKGMWEDQGYKNTQEYLAPDMPMGGGGDMNGPGYSGIPPEAANAGGGGPQAAGQPPPPGVLPGNGGPIQGAMVGGPGMGPGGA